MKPVQHETAALGKDLKERIWLGDGVGKGVWKMTKLNQQTELTEREMSEMDRHEGGNNCKSNLLPFVDVLLRAESVETSNPFQSNVPDMWRPFLHTN